MLPCQIFSIDPDNDNDEIEDFTGRDFWDLIEDAERLFRKCGVNIASYEELYSACVTSTGKVVGATVAGNAGYLDEDGELDPRPTIRFSTVVDEQLRRKGVARGLVQDIVDAYPEDEFVLEAWVINPHMVSLLTEFGFETMGREWSLDSPMMTRQNPDPRRDSYHWNSYWPSRTRWTTGACGGFAVALHQMTGLPLYAYLWWEPNYPHVFEEGHPELGHAFVLTPKGTALDAEGEHAIKIGETKMEWESGIGDDTHPITGEKGQWWLTTVEPVTHQQLYTIRTSTGDVCAEEIVRAKEWILAHPDRFGRWLKRKNPDEEMRKLEREWRRSSDIPAFTAWIRQMLRTDPENPQLDPFRCDGCSEVVLSDTGVGLKTCSECNLKHCSKCETHFSAQFWTCEACGDTVCDGTSFNSEHPFTVGQWSECYKCGIHVCETCQQSLDPDPMIGRCRVCNQMVCTKFISVNHEACSHAYHDQHDPTTYGGDHPYFICKTHDF